ncbi:hypothetical protein C8Q74DRAFT_883950 [Fomes fomentarius]|nr:hypothetical protein C8Q74DRAFT_883950 [Fomes fomentarius]
MPSLPVIEIVFAPASDAQRNSPHDVEIGNTTFSILREQEGLVKIYHGLQHEDKRTCYHLIAWESLEHHERMVSNAATYSTLRRSITSIFDTSAGELQIFHVKPTTEPYKAFEAPVLEIATFTLNEGKSKPALESLVQELANAVLGGLGVVDASSGAIVEKPDAVALFIGWTTVEAHRELVQSDPKLIDSIINSIGK